LKRCFDLMVLFLAAPIWVPFLAVVALAVRQFLGSPVLFRQERPGRDGRLFVMTKFRTMTDGRDADGQLLSDGERLTRFGRFLRSTSLDELPGLLNVLKGDMSLVGPRPLLVRYLPLYTDSQRRRHEVAPGITGWAQVNGRNTVGWEDKFRMDVWYVDHRSFLLDLKILWLTVWKVIRRDGISAEGEATMPFFEGSPDQRTTNGHE
jgi:lipopolysaccharide/colanic/teichoic acid biosynthesis glycosyltransferase